MSDSILDDDSILPLPPIDIELTDTFPIPENLPEEILAELPAELPEENEDEAEPDFEDTMVIAPDASLSKKSSGNSTEAFIERVKELLRPPAGVGPSSATFPVVSLRSTTG